MLPNFELVYVYIKSHPFCSFACSCSKETNHNLEGRGFCQLEDLQIAMMYLIIATTKVLFPTRAPGQLDPRCKSVLNKFCTVRTKGHLLYCVSKDAIQPLLLHLHHVDHGEPVTFHKQGSRRWMVLANTQRPNKWNCSVLGHESGFSHHIRLVLFLSFGRKSSHKQQTVYKFKVYSVLQSCCQQECTSEFTVCQYFGYNNYT